MGSSAYSYESCSKYTKAARVIFHAQDVDARGFRAQMQAGQVHGPGEGHVEVHPVQTIAAEVGVLGVVGAQKVKAASRRCPMQRVREVAGGRCQIRGA